MFTDSISSGTTIHFPDGRRASPEARARILLDCLPESVRIGPHDFAIVRASMFENVHALGHFDPKAHCIRVWPHSSPTNLVDTFLHECLHVMWKHAGLVDSEPEERVVTVLGTSFTALHRDNPWLAGWINGAVQ